MIAMKLMPVKRYILFIITMICVLCMHTNPNRLSIKSEGTEKAFHSIGTELYDWMNGVPEPVGFCSIQLICRYYFQLVALEIWITLLDFSCLSRRNATEGLTCKYDNFIMPWRHIRASWRLLRYQSYLLATVLPAVSCRTAAGPHSCSAAVAHHIIMTMLHDL